MLHRIEHEGSLLALIVRGAFSRPGIHFFTDNDLSQQLAYMNHPAGKVIAPHVHNPVSRAVSFTQEVLFIRRGKLRVDFYGADRTYIGSHILETGDTLLLATGGHGFEVLEDLEMLEVKQGPYVGEGDKTRFDGITGEAVRLREGDSWDGR